MSTGKIAQVEPNSGDMLPIVARSARPSVWRPGPKNSTNFETTPRSRSISVTVRTRSVAVAPSGSSPSTRKPRTCGRSIEIGWPSIAASASIPPTPQPRTPRPFTIVVCESVPTERVGVGLHHAVLLAAEDDLGDVLQVHLVADAGRRRHHAEVVERLLAPAKKRVALLVSLVVAVGVDVEGAIVAERVHLHRVVDHQIDRHERVDLLRIGAQVFHRVAHRGEVDDGGNAREVLHEDARRLVRDLLGRLGLRVPARDRLDVVRGDRLAVLEAEACSRAEPSANTEGGRRRTSPAARRGGRSRTQYPRRRACPWLRSCQSWVVLSGSGVPLPIMTCASRRGIAVASRVL